MYVIQCSVTHLYIVDYYESLGLTFQITQTYYYMFLKIYCYVFMFLFSLVI